MKYQSLKTKSPQKSNIDVLNGGVNLNFIDGEKGFAVCDNLCLKNGRLHSRKGLVVEDVVFVPDFGYNVLKPFTVTEAKANVNGKEKIIAYAIEWDFYSHAYIHVYLVDKEGITPAGIISYDRVSSDSFYVPEKLTFFTGAGAVGSGIYAFIRSRDFENAGYSAFELDADYNEWMRLYGDEFYMPTVYINGRGNKYEEIYGKNYQDKPQELEPLNLLKGWFEAYFTSDGYSSSFKLPIANLDDSSVVCEIYTDYNNYTRWILSQGQNSCNVSFLSYTITFICDRKTGTFSFKVGDLDFSVPIMTNIKSNNIRITAYKTLPGAYEAIIGAENHIKYNSRIYMYGSKERPSMVAVSRQNNPLYFPVGSLYNVGDEDSDVKTMCVCAGRLLALKREGIYQIKNNEGASDFVTDLYIGDKEAIYGKDDLDAEIISTENADIYEKTSSFGDDMSFWLDKDKNICKLSKNNTKISIVSKEIEPFLESLENTELEKMGGIYFDNKYYLWYGNTVWVLILDEENGYSWQSWSFDASIDIISISNIFGELRIICSIGDAEKSYSAKLSGDFDILPNGRGYDTKEIKCKFKTLPLLNENSQTLKRIDTIFVDVSADDDFSIDLNDKRHISCAVAKREFNERKNKTYRINPSLYAVPNLTVSISGKAPISIGKISLIYNELTEIF